MPKRRSLKKKVSRKSGGSEAKATGRMRVRRRSEKAPRAEQGEIERRVQERTAALDRANEELRLEIARQQHSKEHFRLLVEGVRDYAIFLLDPKGRVLSWNLGAERIKGYRAEEIIGEHFSVFYAREEVQAGKPDRALEIAAAEGRFEEEGWRVRKDGSQFWANVLITPLRDHYGNVWGFAKITRDITERKRAEEALHEICGRLFRKQDQEWRRIGGELHDSTSPVLAALAGKLYAARQRARDRDPATEELLAESIALAENASSTIRTFAGLLYPVVLDEQGLVPSLQWYVDQFAARTGIHVETTLPRELKRLPPDLETTIFRIAQESLANVHRHSGSPVAALSLTAEGQNLRLEISDQGRGLPRSVLRHLGKGTTTAGAGIAAMQERMAQLGGRLEISSGSSGLLIRAIVPLARKTAARTP